MKKIIFTLATLLFFICSFAYEDGDYIYTPTVKYKITSDNRLPALIQWTGADDTDTWSAYNEDDATDNCLQSMDGSEGSTILHTSVVIQPGFYYTITLKVKGVAEGPTSIAAGAQNQINAFVTNAAPSADGVLTGTANKDYFMVANSQTILNGEWTEISFALVDTMTEGTIGTDTHYLNIVLGRLTTGTVVADVEVHQVAKVYDTRISDARIDFAKKLLADENFSKNDPKDVNEIIAQYEEMVANGETDDEGAMNDFMDMFNEAVNVFMDQNSGDISAYFTNIGITGVGKYNRGSIANGQQVNNFMFHGDNWLHAQGADVLAKQIQGTYENNAGSVALYNTNLPAGTKYYIAGEVRNALCDKNYNLTFTLEKQVKMFIGSDTLDAGTIVGQEWQKFYHIAELKEGETFEAGFWWEGHTAGSRFEVRNFEVRSFNGEGESLEDQQARKEAVDKFLAQWNAATSARDNVLAKLGDTVNYPWEQDSLQSAYDTWNPYYQKVLDDGWVDAEGKVAGKDVVTNDELDDWTLYQGVELYNEEGTQLQYQLVRGFQNANNYAVAQNKPYNDLKAKVAEVKEALVNPDYATLDATNLNAVLETAEDMINAVTSENQFDDFTKMLSTLTEVLDAFYKGGASFAAPAELTIVDPNFTDKTGNPAGGTTTYWNGSADNPIGWVTYTTNTSEYFRIGDGGKDADGEYIYEGHNRASMWRGWTGSPAGSITQEITVSKAGHYDFKCQAYCTIDPGTQAAGIRDILNGVRKVNIQYEWQQVWNEEFEDWTEEEVEVSRDTVYMSGVKLFFGSATENEVDSIEIWTHGESATVVWTPQWFTIGYDKKTDGEEVLRFGLDGTPTAEYRAAGIYTYSPNAYGLGSVHILYCGPSDKYYKDKSAHPLNITSDILISTIEELEEITRINISSGASLSIKPNIGNNSMTLNSFSMDMSMSSLEFAQVLCSPDLTFTITGDLSQRIYTQDSTWYFLSLPFDCDLSRLQNESKSQYAIRYYDGASRAASNMDSGNWKNFGKNDIIPMGTGFIFMTQEPSWTHFYAVDNENKAHVFQSVSSQTTLQLAANTSAQTRHSGWNLVGNPYANYYSIHAMDFSRAVTVWTGESYEAIFPSDDDLALRPGQAFFVQCPSGVESITLPGSGRQLTSEVSSAARARRAAMNRGKDRRLINLTLSDSQFTDKTRVVLNEAASLDYEPDCDAGKFMSLRPEVPQLFTLEADGTRYAINERPEADGTGRLGVYIPQDGEYTLSLTRNDGTAILLTDSETGLTADLAASGSYTFRAAKGTYASRFLLTFGTGATGIATVPQETDSGTNATEYYDLSGRRIQKPQRPGIYLQKNGTTVRKMLK